MNLATHQPQAPNPDPHRDDDDDGGWFSLLWSAWWTRLVLGAIAIGAGLYIHQALAAREASGGTTRMPAIFAAIYGALGKTGILVVFLVIGAVAVVSALYTRIRRGRAGAS